MQAVPIQAFSGRPSEGAPAHPDVHRQMHLRLDGQAGCRVHSVDMTNGSSNAGAHATRWVLAATILSGLVGAQGCAHSAPPAGAPPGTLEVGVFNQRGEPMPGLPIKVERADGGWQQEAKSSAPKGNFLFRSLTPGAYKILRPRAREVHHPGGPGPVGRGGRGHGRRRGRRMPVATSQSGRPQRPARRIRPPPAHGVLGGVPRRRRRADDQPSRRAAGVDRRAPARGRRQMRGVPPDCVSPGLARRGGGRGRGLGTIKRDRGEQTATRPANQKSAKAGSLRDRSCRT